MQENDVMCDCHVIDKHFDTTQLAYKAHSILLAANSTYFYDLLAPVSVTEAKTVQIYELTFDAIACGINFIYGRYPSSAEEREMLKKCAEHLGIGAALDYLSSLESAPATVIVKEEHDVSEHVESEDVEDSNDKDTRAVVRVPRTKPKPKKITRNNSSAVVSKELDNHKITKTLTVNLGPRHSMANKTTAPTPTPEDLVVEYDDLETAAIEDSGDLVEMHDIEYEAVKEEKEGDDELITTLTQVDSEGEEMTYILANMDAEEDETMQTHLEPAELDNDENQMYERPSSISLQNVPCPVCLKTQRTLGMLKTHISRVHLRKQNVLQCPLCGLEKEQGDHQRKKMTYHIAQHYQDDPTTADKIMMKYEAGFYKGVEPADNTQCQMCGRKFKTPLNLKVHKKICKQNEANITVCRVCSQDLLTSSALVEHMHTAHMKKKFFICTLCGKLFCNENAITGHFKDAHQIESTYPHLKLVKAVVTPLNIDTYLNMLQDPRLDESRTLFQNVYPCMYCSSIFMTLDELAKDMISHVVATETVVRPLQLNQYECHFCGNMSRSNKSNTHHVLELHADDLEDAIFQCEVCHLKFLKKEHLRSHELTHSDTMKYVCDICGKRFRFVQGVRTHMQIMHTKKDILQCEVCDFSTNRKSVMESHELRHKDYKAFHCDLCENSYHTRLAFARHRELKHKTH